MARIEGVGVKILVLKPDRWSDSTCGFCTAYLDLDKIQVPDGYKLKHVGFDTIDSEFRVVLVSKEESSNAPAQEQYEGVSPDHVCRSNAEDPSPETAA